MSLQTITNYKVVETNPDEWGDRHAYLVAFTVEYDAWFLIESSDGTFRTMESSFVGSKAALIEKLGFHRPYYVEYDNPSEEI